MYYQNQCVEAFKKAKRQVAQNLGRASTWGIVLRDDAGRIHVLHAAPNPIGLKPMSAFDEADYWLTRAAQIEDMGGR